MSCQQLRHEEIMPRLTKIVVEVLGVRPESVRSEANFWTDLGADSLDDYDLSMRCEREFDIKWGPFGALVELAPNGLQLDPNGFLNESFLEQWYASTRSSAKSSRHRVSLDQRRRISKTCTQSTSWPD